MATTKDYQTALNTVNNWLQKYAGMYAGMIPQQYIQAISHAVVDAVDAERAGKPAPALAPFEHQPMASGSVLVEMALSMLNLNDAEKDLIRASIPTSSDMVKICSDNKEALLALAKDWQTAGPAVKIVAKAIADMEKLPAN